MGIGRRKFIALSTAALLGISVNPLQAVITNDDLYLNKKLGIMFYKPNSWGFVKVKDFGKLREAQHLQQNNGRTQEEIWNDLSDPICIATKFPQDLPENHDVFSPTITLSINHESVLDNEGTESFEELIMLSEIGISSILKDFKVVHRHDPYYISNVKFYENDAEYLFEHKDISDPLKVEVKVLLAKHNDYYYAFNCHQSTSQNQIAQQEFDEFKKTIKLI
jgi:hypothetical protein